VPSITIDTSEPGEHTIDYVATNAAGTSTSTRTVIIEARDAGATPLNTDEPPTQEPAQEQPPKTASLMEIDSPPTAPEQTAADQPTPPPPATASSTTPTALATSTPAQ
jgi:hypothetical protein